MDFGSSLLLFGLDIELFQGIIDYLYQNNPSFRVVRDENGFYSLELDIPTIQTLDDNEGYRLIVHLTGQLSVVNSTEPLVFDAWVRLCPEVGTDTDGIPVGVLRYETAENVTPSFAQQAVEDVFGPDGIIGKALEDLTIPVFKDMITSVHEQIYPGITLDVSRFAVAFYLGHAAPMRHPYWNVEHVDGDMQPVLFNDYTLSTVPALIASVALAGNEPKPPNNPSIVWPRTGLTLVTTAALFTGRFAIESAASIGTKMKKLTIDRLEISSTDYGFYIDGAGHKTGATVEFAGSLVGIFRGGTGGNFLLKSTIKTDVDTDWWVDLLSVICNIVPVLGWILGDIYIWTPTEEAPEDVEAALLEKFTVPLKKTAQQISESFAVDQIPTDTFLADVWFFDGNMAVAGAAFAGHRTCKVEGVTFDIAYLAKDPAGKGRYSNRRRTVKSVYEIELSGGHKLKPWQAGSLVAAQILTIPGYHSVRSPLAKEGYYLRGNPDDDTTNNLLSS